MPTTRSEKRTPSGAASVRTTSPLCARLTTVQLVRAYRVPLAAALPAGFVLGALFGLGLFASSNEEARTLGWFGYTVMLGAGVGVAAASVAALGAASAVKVRSQRTDEDSAHALGAIALGGGLGVAIVTIFVGTGISIAEDYWSQWEFWLIASVVLGVIAAASAAAVTAATTRLWYR